MFIKKYVPYSTLFELTLRCNMRCIHCGSSAGSQREEELTTDEWIKITEGAFLNAEREAWGMAFYINTSLFKDKIDPERNTLLDALAGHKKEEERRPINFDLLEKVRILMAYCLPDRVYEKAITHKDGNLETSDQLDSSYINQMESMQESNTSRPTIQINNDSVLFDRNPISFVCGKQQVIVHAVDPDPTPVPVMHVSYLAELNPSWLSLIEKSKHSIIALGMNISIETAKDKISSDSIIKRLFLDQVFPLGSRYVCELSKQLEDTSWEIRIQQFVRYPLEIIESFRGDEPEIVGGLDIDENNENWNLVDTLLTEEDVLILNPEEDVIPAWEDLVNDSAEIEEIDSGENIGSEENIKSPIHLEKINNRILQDGPRCKLIVDSISSYKSLEIITAEVVDFTFSDETSTILLKPVPEHEPFDIFVEKYKAGDEVEVEVIAYDERPGDFMVSLVVREQSSGLEILLEPERISFSTRSFFVKEIPIGTKLRLLLEAINLASQRVYMTYLHQTEKHLELIIQNQKSITGTYEADAVVKEVSQGRVYFLIDWSDPDNGFIHVTSIAGRGLHKGSAELYTIGEKCRLKLQFSQYDTHSNLDELPEEVADIIGKQKAFTNLSYRDKTLLFHGRMSYTTLKELLTASIDKKFQRALYDLYRYSNMLIAFTIVADWGKTVSDKYPVGTIISNAKICENVSSGSLVELEVGIKGLLRNNDMAHEVNPGDLITVTVLKMDPTNQRISLSMGERFLEKILIPSSKVGLVIGRKGDMIKSIMEQTNTSIDTDNNVNGQTEFCIWGKSHDDVQRAKDRIESIAFRFK